MPRASRSSTRSAAARKSSATGPWKPPCTGPASRSEGKNLTAAFQDLGVFPALVIRMLRIGENTGALDTALLNVSYFYNREVKESIGKVQAMIEPALTLVLGAILGWVMLSVLGPVYDTISKMKF